MTDSVVSVRSCYADRSMVTFSLFCNHRLLWGLVSYYVLNNNCHSHDIQLLFMSHQVHFMCIVLFVCLGW